MVFNKVADSDRSIPELILRSKDLFPFPSMPNFRLLVEKRELTEKHFNRGVPYSDAKMPSYPELTGFKNPGLAKVYRSSHPDSLSKEDMKLFLSINIKGIIDLRSLSEYNREYALKLIDEFYPIYKVKVPKFRLYRPGEKVEFVPVLKGRSGQVNGKHFLIDFFGMNFKWRSLRNAPGCWRAMPLCYFIYDMLVLRGNSLIRFIGGHRRLSSQYIKILHSSRNSICAVLKLLSDPGNIPALLNCAFGKDRTGITSAIVLSCLGYSREYICADYARTIIQLKPMMSDSGESLSEEHPLEDAYRKVMERVLDHIDTRFGGISSYLEHIGFLREDQRQLIKNLTE